MKDSHRRLLVFAREPRRGQVKTRLIPELGEDKATRMYHRMLEHTLEQGSALADCQLELWCDWTGDDCSDCLRLARQYTFALHRQTGGDLGERMGFALKAALESSNQVILIGSDCPEYSTAYLTRAFDALMQHDVVLGPAFDGGYVLIGMSRYVADLFTGIPWGSNQVLDLTRERIYEAGLNLYELPVVRDVDMPEDIKAFRAFFKEVIDA